MSGPDQPRAGRGKSPLFVLFLVVVVDLIGFGLVLPLLPRYATDFHASGLETGLLQASFSLMQLVFMPLWGRLSDRIGRRPVLMVGLAGSVLSYALFGLADSLALLFVSRIAAGVFGATIGTAQAYIADVTSQADRGKGMAVIGAAFGLGFAIGPTIGGLAHDNLGPAAPGFIAAGLSLFAFLFAWRSLPEPARHESLMRRGLFGGGLRHALATPTLPLVIGLQFVATFAFANFEGTLSLLTKVKWSYDPTHNGFLFSYVGICLLVFQGAVVRRLMPRVGELNFVVAGTLTLVAGLAGVALAATTTQVLAVLPFAVLGFSMLTPSLASLLSRRTPASMQGEVLGLGQSSLALARILGPFVGITLMGIRHPSPDVTEAATAERPYWFAAAVMGAAFVGSLVLRARPVPDAASPPAAG
jgi:MFS transporter, DHA1 family, tetracycline resistance protein